MEGLREHQKVHKGSLFKCEKCTKTFTTARAKKRHLHDIHGKKLNLKCQHCGHVSHTCCTLYLTLKNVALRTQTGFHCIVTFAQRGPGTQGPNYLHTKGRTTNGSKLWFKYDFGMILCIVHFFE